MSDVTEEQVKQRLGIDSWRNLSKDGVVQLVAMMPDMSKDVALNIAEHFPDFKLLATETLNSVSRQLKTTLNSNKKSHKRAQKAFERVHDVLARELDRDDLSSEERRDLYDRLLQVAEKVAEKDFQGKQFALTALKIAGATVGVIVAGAVAILVNKGKPNA
jgi:hypothetical protein